MPLEQEPRLSFNVPSKWNRFIAVGRTGIGAWASENVGYFLGVLT
jgi:hypothetical protein